MLAKILTGATTGLDGALVEVEVDLAQGLPKATIVGLPDAAVQEARERVRAAIRNSGLPFPMKRITVNLAPAEVRKEGAGFDVPIAIAILAAAGLVPAPKEPILFLGELSLDGALRHTTGVLPLVALAREQRIKTVVVPAVNAAEAALIEGIDVIPAESLRHLAMHLCGDPLIAPFAPGDAESKPVDPLPVPDFADVQGQEHVKADLVEKNLVEPSGGRGRSTAYRLRETGA
jgi:magnesium chelatase family protein